MSFGFSVGDLISITRLVHSTFTLLQNAPTEFRALNLEVLTLSTTLHSLADEANSPHSILRSVSEDRQRSYGLLLNHVSVGLRRLQFVVLKYPSLGEGERAKLRERIGMAVRGFGGEERGVREKLAVHTAGLNAVLSSLSAGALGRVENLMRELVRKGAASTTNINAQKSNSGDDWSELWEDIEQELKSVGIGFEEVKRNRAFVVDDLKRLVHNNRISQGEVPPTSLSRPLTPKRHSGGPMSAGIAPLDAVDQPADIIKIDPAMRRIEEMMAKRKTRRSSSSSGEEVVEVRKLRRNRSPSPMAVAVPAKVPQSISAPLDYDTRKKLERLELIEDDERDQARRGLYEKRLKLERLKWAREEKVKAKKSDSPKQDSDSSQEKRQRLAAEAGKKTSYSKPTNDYESEEEEHKKKMEKEDALYQERVRSKFTYAGYSEELIENIIQKSEEEHKIGENTDELDDAIRIIPAQDPLHREENKAGSFSTRSYRHSPITIEKVTSRRPSHRKVRPPLPRRGPKAFEESSDGDFEPIQLHPRQRVSTGINQSASHQESKYRSQDRSPPALESPDIVDELTRMFKHIFDVDAEAFLAGIDQPSTPQASKLQSPRPQGNSPTLTASAPTSPRAMSDSAEEERPQEQNSSSPLVSPSEGESIRAAATTLSNRLTKLSAAEEAGDIAVSSDLRFYAIPDDAIRLRGFGVPVMECNACKLPIRKDYWMCLHCPESKMVCERCQDKACEKGVKGQISKGDLLDLDDDGGERTWASYLID